MNNTNRRTFILRAAAAGSGLSVAAAHAQPALPKLLEETDPQAVALGYKHDTSKVDAKKYPKHAKSQDCANCQLFQAKAKDPTGLCPLFAGKQVAAAGWCTAWSKKVS